MEGNIDSRTVLDTLGLAGSTQTLQLMRCLLARNAADALALFDRLYRGGKDVAALLGELSDLARDMTVMKAAPEGGAALLSGVYDRRTLTDLGRDLPMSRFLYMADTLQGCCAALADSIRPRTAAELCLLKLCDESLSGDLTAFDRRLAGWSRPCSRAAYHRVRVPPPGRETPPSPARLTKNPLCQRSRLCRRNRPCRDRPSGLRPSGGVPRPSRAPAVTPSRAPAPQHHRARRAAAIPPCGSACWSSTRAACR